MRFPLYILCSVLAAYALGFWLTVPANPEVKFWSHVDAVRNAEIAAARAAQPTRPLILFTGGSSCAFSIDPKIIEEKCGMPAFNLGLPVAAGGGYLLHQALEKAHKGDILVISLEPDLLTYPDDFKGGQFNFAMASVSGHPSAASGGSSFQRALGLRDYLNLSRPGPGYLTTWLAKAATGRGYRYTPEDIRYHGRLETSISIPDIPPVQAKTVTSITPQARRFLITFQNAATAKGVRLVYSMPWMLTAESAANQTRDANRKILDSINTIIPAIDDGFQGIHIDPACFADSRQHLAAKGSAIRTHGLANALQAWLTSDL
jgi:hypothetical protein